MYRRGHLTGAWEAEWCSGKKDEAVLWTCVVTPGQICGILKSDRICAIKLSGFMILNIFFLIEVSQYSHVLRVAMGKQ